MSIKIKGNKVINDSKEWIGDFLPGDGTYDDDIGSTSKKWRDLYLNGTVHADKAEIADSLETNKLYIGDTDVSNNGYFHSDTAGRTAFNGGKFYIKSGVSHYYNYAPSQYHGDLTGSTHYFRGNALTGDDWSISTDGIGDFDSLKVNGSTAIDSSGYVKTDRLYIGPGSNDGYFYSDSAGRTAFTDGDFYIRNSVTHYYNYATNQYHGGTSGDSIMFRGNTISGDDWNVTGAGIGTFEGVVGDYINTPMIASTGTTLAQQENASWNLGEHVWNGETHTRLWLKGKTPSIELDANDSTPYIDFITGKTGSSGDYDIRLIATGNDLLEVQGGGLKIGGELTLGSRDNHSSQICDSCGGDWPTELGCWQPNDRVNAGDFHGRANNCSGGYSTNREYDGEYICLCGR